MSNKLCINQTKFLDSKETDIDNFYSHCKSNSLFTNDNLLFEDTCHDKKLVRPKKEIEKMDHYEIPKNDVTLPPTKVVTYDTTEPCYNNQDPFQNYNPNTKRYETTMNKGIVSTNVTNREAPFKLFQESNKGPEENFNDSVSNILDGTILSKVYFSRKNINNLQQKIKSGIQLKSEGKLRVGDQSETQLKIIMRSIYLTHSKNVDCNIQQQISQLNNKILQYCIENVMTNAVQYINYLNDLNKTPSVRKNPESTYKRESFVAQPLNIYRE